MSPVTKKICLFVLVFLVLEVLLLVGWNGLSSLRTATAPQTEPHQAQTLAATVPSTQAPETAPPTAETTVPAETEPEEALPPETQPAETVPEETAAESTEPQETVPEETVPAATEAVIREYTLPGMPHYYQNDYPDIRYENSTLDRCGSGMTALAMVATYMTEHTYYPDEVTDYVAPFIGTHYERLEHGSDLLGLSWKRARNIHEVFQAVKDGKVAIVLMNHKSVFTESSHYLILTGVTEEGKITLVDPDRNHYSRQGIDDYLENGIREGLLYSGFEGGWIYDIASMPEQVDRYEPEPRAAEPRYPDITLSASDMKLMADIIWLEGRSEPFEGQQAIAEVILNRLASGDFGKSISAVIRAEGQFPSVEYLYKAEPTHTQYKAIELAMYGPYILDEDVVFYAKFAVNDNVWGKIGAHTFCRAY